MEPKWWVCDVGAVVAEFTLIGGLLSRTMNVVNRTFAQVDVFTSTATRGNPVAVVLDAEGLDDDAMAAFARWTNLSETTFVLPPTDPAADYLLRIFTPGGELPFAGHPTLGSAHAWLARGAKPAGDRIVQECGVGLVPIRRDGDRLAFAAPALSRSGPVDDETVAEVSAALGIAVGDVLAAQWVVNGPEWMVLELDSGATVLGITPDMAALGSHLVGVVGAYPDGLPGEPEVAYEVRAFVPEIGVPEDPVTGSLNAGIATWLRAAGRIGSGYVAAQGTVLQRTGRVHISVDGGDIWVGGDCVGVISGEVDL